MRKVIPLGGKHRSASSLLAEIMNDTNMVKCAVVTLDADGNTGVGQFEMSRGELAYAALLLQDLAMDPG